MTRGKVLSYDISAGVGIIGCAQHDGQRAEVPFYKNSVSLGPIKEGDLVLFQLLGGQAHKIFYDGRIAAPVISLVNYRMQLKG